MDQLLATCTTTSAGPVPPEPAAVRTTGLVPRAARMCLRFLLPLSLLMLILMLLLH